jgi:hypothetical protein
VTRGSWRLVTAPAPALLFSIQLKVIECGHNTPDLTTQSRGNRVRPRGACGISRDVGTMPQEIRSSYMHPVPGWPGRCPGRRGFPAARRWRAAAEGCISGEDRECAVTEIPPMRHRFLGPALRRYRESVGLGLDDAARIVGVGTSKVSRDRGRAARHLLGGSGGPAGRIRRGRGRQPRSADDRGPARRTRLVAGVRRSCPSREAG